MIGKNIAHYKILEKLGEGGMGVVYKARDAKLDREVAIKFLPHHVAVNKEERERFKIEAKAAAALNHPNIATIHAIEEADDEMFIVMEYIEGQELRDIVGAYRNTPLPVDQIIHYATQIASGLKAAHKKGIIHRDIKSANIMITEEGTVKIMDFGLAKIGGGAKLTKANSTLGTAAYMSPEQARGQNVDQRSDIWSFGVVLYEMLSGELPFGGEYEQAVMYAIVNEAPKELEVSRNGVPPELERILDKTLAKNPMERYPDGAELLTDLKKVTKNPEDNGRRTTAALPPASKSRLPFSSRRSLYIGSIVVVILGAILFYLLRPLQPVSRGASSLAVLPFTNQRNQKELEYLSDGITETLIDQLSPISNLKVMARSTVFHFKGANIDPRKVGRELKVKTVLTGRIDLFENRLIVSTELLDVASGAQIWGKRYNRQMADIFEIESEISRNIVDKLRLHLGSGESTHLTRRLTESSEAYQLYLKGRFYWNKRSAESMPVALGYFQRAVQIDPQYGLAWTGIADTYLVGWAIYLNIPWKEAYKKGKAAALKAIEIDNSLAEAHTSLASLRITEWDWKSAEQEFKRALELNPSYVTAHQWYGELLYTLGRYDESITEINKALELDPLSLIVNSVLGWAYLASRNTSRAMEQIRRTLEMEPDFADAQDALVQIMLLQRRPESEIFPELIKRDRDFSVLSEDDSTAVIKSFKKNGLEGYWKTKLEILLKRSQLKYIWPGYLAECYAQLGENQKAIDNLEQLYERRDPLITYIRIWAFFEPLKTDPRFRNIVRKLNFPG